MLEYTITFLIVFVVYFGSFLLFLWIIAPRRLSGWWRHRPRYEDNDGPENRCERYSRKDFKKLKWRRRYRV